MSTLKAIIEDYWNGDSHNKIPENHIIKSCEREILQNFESDHNKYIEMENTLSTLTTEYEEMGFAQGFKKAMELWSELAMSY